MNKKGGGSPTRMEDKHGDNIKVNLHDYIILSKMTTVNNITKIRLSDVIDFCVRAVKNLINKGRRSPFCIKFQRNNIN